MFSSLCTSTGIWSRLFGFANAKFGFWDIVWCRAEPMSSSPSAADRPEQLCPGAASGNVQGTTSSTSSRADGAGRLRGQEEQQAERSAAQLAHYLYVSKAGIEARGSDVPTEKKRVEVV